MRVYVYTSPQGVLSIDRYYENDNGLNTLHVTRLPKRAVAATVYNDWLNGAVLIASLSPTVIRTRYYR